MLLEQGRFLPQREAQARIWLTDRMRRKFGEIGLAHVDIDARLSRHGGPFSADYYMTEDLMARLSQGS